jgi:anti-sigma factor RsiW
MSKIQEMNVCGRAEQLVGYLYGETNAQERASFESHLSECVACRDELAAFGQVREAVGAWRAELLTHAPGVVAADVMPAGVIRNNDSPHTSRDVSSPRRSAWDALREFFVLSPAWLRFGTVAAALVVCALATLAVANAEVGRENGNLVFRTGVWHATHERTTVPTRATEAGNDSTAQLNQSQLSQAQLDQLVAERDAARRELEDARAQLDDSRAANIEAVYHDIEESQPDPAPQQTAPPSPGTSRQRRANTQRKSARRATSNEEDLPRLLDLLGSGN